MSNAAFCAARLGAPSAIQAFASYGLQAHAQQSRRSETQLLFRKAFSRPNSSCERRTMSQFAYLALCRPATITIQLPCI